MLVSRIPRPWFPLVALALVAAPAVAGAAPHRPAMRTAARATVAPDVRAAIAVDGRAPVLVLLRDDGTDAAVTAAAPDDDVRSAVAALQRAVLSDVPAGSVSLTNRYELVPGFGGEVTATGLTALEQHPLVKAVELARLEKPMLAEHVAVVHGRQVADWYGFTGEGVNVAVLDTGVDTDHPDLADDIVGQVCFSEAGGCGDSSSTRGESAEDEYGHGTTVAGIITAKGVASAPGIAPDAGIVAVRVFGDGDPPQADLRDVVSGLDWANANRTRLGIKIVNMSLGSDQTFVGNCDSQDQTRARAVDNLVNRGVLVVVASGNGGASNAMSTPGCLRNSLSVGATYDDVFVRSPERGSFAGGCVDTSTTTAMVACFTNVSRQLDVVAPGVWTTAPKRGGGVTTGAGTSFASPMVAGVAALVLQASPNLKPAQLESVLEATGVEASHPGTGLTFPRVDALAAVESVVPVTVTPRPTATTTSTPTASATRTPTTTRPPPTTRPTSQTATYTLLLPFAGG